MEILGDSQMHEDENFDQKRVDFKIVPPDGHENNVINQAAANRYVD